MREILKEQKRLLAAWLIAEFFCALLTVGMSLFMKQMSDTAYGTRGLQGVRERMWFGIFLALACLALEYAWRICRAGFLRVCNLSLKKKIFGRIVRLDIYDFHEDNNGKYISLLNNDLRMVDEKYFRVLPVIFSQINMLVVALIVMCLYYPLLALLQVILCVPQLLAPMAFGRKASEKQKNYMDSLDAWNAQVKDIFAGFEVVKSFGIEDKIKEKYRRAIREVEKNGFDMRIWQAKSIALSSVALYASFVAQTLFAVYLIFQGEITMGILLGAMQIGNYVGNPAREISTLYLEYRTIRPVLARISAVLDGAGEAGEEGERTIPVTVTPLRIEKISFSYSSGQPVLFHLDYQFEAGKKYAIVGGSGSGKSTLLRLLMGYFNQYEGGIFCGEKRQTELDKKSLYRHITMIHQRVFLFDDTLRNNITLYGTYSDEEVWQAVDDAGLRTVVREMGHGLDSRIEEGGRNLSGGEQQRIAIARAFLHGAEVLLVDEGTASLDYENARMIDALLLDKQGLTLISVTHKMNPELLRRYDEVLVLEQGRILEHGPYESLSREQRQLLEWRSQEEGEAI